MSQNESILKSMMDGARITPLDALHMFGCFRLAARIHDLRERGHQIQTRTVKNEDNSYSEYWI